eukprot:TRINITY_DN1863_c0_g2_i1.p1 TRINITY_DN1863_c0_g2~~TRINITY_DN1863_c0_g2_i1.p1  ORF type:complete len:731 (+),score=273.52 TRINITY_DN1863_c0_g2_i1:70-2193(+)
MAQQRGPEEAAANPAGLQPLATQLEQTAATGLAARDPVARLFAPQRSGVPCILESSGQCTLSEGRRSARTARRAVPLNWGLRRRELQRAMHSPAAAARLSVYDRLALELLGLFPAVELIVSTLTSLMAALQQLPLTAAELASGDSDLGKYIEKERADACNRHRRRLHEDTAHKDRLSARERIAELSQSSDCPLPPMPLELSAELQAQALRRLDLEVVALLARIHAAAVRLGVGPPCDVMRLPGRGCRLVVRAADPQGLLRVTLGVLPFAPHPAAVWEQLRARSSAELTAAAPAPVHTAREEAQGAADWLQPERIPSRALELRVARRVRRAFDDHASWMWEVRQRFGGQGEIPFYPLCPLGADVECTRCPDVSQCENVHITRVILPHTKREWGDCPYLDGCRRQMMCEYVHYKIIPPRGADLELVRNIYISSQSQRRDAAGRPVPFSVGMMGRPLLPAQWIQCDIRKFDLRVLGKFQVIMADPPWDINMALPYGIIKDDEMRRLDISSLSDDGVLFLWVTARAMELGRELIKLWGYELKQELVWVKVDQTERVLRQGRTGHWLNHSKETCLIAVKGHPAINRGLDSDVLVSVPRETSRKPDEIYGMIERLCPDGRKLELFGRNHNIRDGWLTLGNQLQGMSITEPQLRDDFNRWVEEAYTSPAGNDLGPEAPNPFADSRANRKRLAELGDDDVARSIRRRTAVTSRGL